MKQVKALALFALGLSVMLSSGCASLGNATEQTAEQLVVEYSTLKVIGTGKTTADKQAIADRITKIVTVAMTDVTSPSATIATITSLVNAQILTLKLPAQEQPLADALVAEVGAELANKIGAGVLSPAQVVTVNTVLGWVKQAASYPVS